MKALALILLASIGFLSCSPSTAESKTAGKQTTQDAKSAQAASSAEKSGEATGSGAQENNPGVNVSADLRPQQISASAREALQALGLTVFDEPAQIPYFGLKTPLGASLATTDFTGKLVMLNFWATWCPPCREEMPSMQTLYDKYKDKGFSIFAISVKEDLKTVSSFLKKTPYSFPIALDPDGAISDQFVGRGIPTTYFMDRKGQVIAGVVGGTKWDTPEVFKAIETLLAQ